MTIHEFTRLVPMGSRIRLHYAGTGNSAPAAGESGIVRECIYSKDDTGEGRQHKIIIENKEGDHTCTLRDVLYVDILDPPDDYGYGYDNIIISEAENHLFRGFNKMFDPNFDPNAPRKDLSEQDIQKNIRDQQYHFRDDFEVPILQTADVLDRYGLDVAARQLRSLAVKDQFERMNDQEWFSLFSHLASKRLELQHHPDASWLRRADAIFCILAPKSRSPYAHIAPHRTAQLVLANLVEDDVSVLAPNAYDLHMNDHVHALDWFLLSFAYFRAGMQESCAYVAMVQSILHRGCFFDNRTNRRLFCCMCGGAHDFTFVKQLLCRCQSEDGTRDMYPKDHLVDMGRLMCWMLYQMGGPAALDAMELLPLAEAKNLTADQLRDMHERMLAYTCKYGPRNRQDRFMAVSGTMSVLLHKLKQKDAITMIDDILTIIDDPILDHGTSIPYSKAMFGYIYEFHGKRGAELREVNGYILGSNLLPYWFSFDLDSCHTDTAIQLQDRYNAADMDHTRLLLPVYFIETPPGSIKGKLATYDLRMIPGGEISL